MFRFIESSFPFIIALVYFGYLNRLFVFDCGRLLVSVAECHLPRHAVCSPIPGVSPIKLGDGLGKTDAWMRLQITTAEKAIITDVCWRMLSLCQDAIHSPGFKIDCVFCYAHVCVGGGGGGYRQKTS